MAQFILLFFAVTIIQLHAFAAGPNASEIREKYPPGSFFMGLGAVQDTNETRAIQNATDQARAELAKAIRANIKTRSHSEKTATQEFEGGKKAFERIIKTYSRSDSVEASVNNVDGIDVKQADFDNETLVAHALVVLDRLKFAERTTPTLVNSGKLASAHYDAALQSEKSLKRIQFFKKAAIELQRTEGLADLYDSVRPDGTKSVNELRGMTISRVLQALNQELHKVLISVQTTGDPKVTNHIIAEVNQSGLRVDPKAGLSLKVIMEVRVRKDRLLASAGIVKATGLVNVTILDGNDTVTAFIMEDTGSGQDDESAIEAAKNAIAAAIKKDFINKLVDNL
ncbi:hypothetical protein WDW37_08135 [Bdellovibrionota bacterium FG-1]